MSDESSDDPTVLRDLFAQFDGAPVESLLTQPESTSEDARGFKIVNDLKQAKLEKAKQQNKLREHFFIWTFVLASLIIVGNFALMVYYAISLDGNVPDQVMTFWISATVVQIIGIIYIIAQYLFPKPRGESRKR